MKLPANFYEPDLHASGIYGIRHVESGRVYVGSTVNISHRWRWHYSNLNKGTHHAAHLQRAWAKYGPMAFEFEVIEWCNREALLTREQEHIDAIPEGEGYNTTSVAGSCVGCKRTEAQLLKFSRAKRHLTDEQIVESKARYLAGETMQAIADSMGVSRSPVKYAIRGKYLGDQAEAVTIKISRSPSEETRKKLSDATRGKPKSPEARERIAAALRSRQARTAEKLRQYTRSPEGREATRLRMLGNQQTKGTHLSDAHREAISKCNKGRVLSQETRDRMSAAQQKLADKKSEARRGIPWSAARRLALTDEVLAKMSASQKGRPASAEALANLARGREIGKEKLRKPGLKRQPWSDARRAVMAAAIAARKSTEIVQ